VLLLLQVRQGRQGEREAIWPQRFQEPFFNLPIQSLRTQALTICSAKLALIGAPAIFGPFALLTGIVQVE